MPARGQRKLRVGRVSETGRVYLVTTCTFGRVPVFDCAASARIVADSLVGEGVAPEAMTLAYVVMPDHLHWLLKLIGGSTLQAVVGQVKGRSAHCINRSRRRQGRIWQPGFHDHAMRNEENLRRAADYIIHNPVRAGLVESAGDYPYWDTVWHRRGVTPIGDPHLKERLQPR